MLIIIGSTWTTKTDSSVKISFGKKCYGTLITVGDLYCRCQAFLQFFVDLLRFTPGRRFSFYISHKAGAYVSTLTDDNLNSYF